MADTDGAEKPGEQRILASTISNPSDNSSGTQSSLSPTQGWNRDTDPIPPASAQFDLHEWAKRNIHIFDPAENQARPRGVLFQDLSIQGSDSSLQVQPTVLSTLARPVLAILNPLLRKECHQNGPASILHNFDGFVREGELLLVLGRPRSGCSTFLKAICGHLDGLTLDAISKIEYQGIAQCKMTKEHRGEVLYNQQEDHHFPHLTVGETLEFAARARAPHIRPGSMSRDEYAKMAVQVVMALFGLFQTQDTQVGNEYIRGVSGGERKRVSIAEMTLARARICAWDNSTRGLDANSALGFVQALRLSANLTKTCHVAAVYQASEHMYSTFDNVTVLYSGRQVYFGPCEHAVAYFEKMGWKRHPQQTIPDFLTAVTNPIERESRADMIEKIPQTSEEFETYWKQSPEFSELREKMKSYQQRFPHGGAEEGQLDHAKNSDQANRVCPSSPFLLSVPMQLRLCLVRGLRRSRNDCAGIVVTAVVQMVMALLIGSLFYNIPDTSAGLSQRASALFLAVLTNCLIAMMEINVLFGQRPIIEKHSRYKFVRPFTEASAGAIIDLPIKLLRCVISSVIIYFMANLQREAGHFFIFLLLQLVSVVTLSGIFRCLATVTKTISQAMAFVGIIVICIAVYTGFTVPQPNMRPWLGWIRWINPIFYTFEGIIANEFHGLQAKCVELFPNYAALSGPYFTCLETGAVPGERYVSGDRYIAKHYDYSYSHLWRNLGIVIGFCVFFHVVYLILTEFTSGAASKPMTLAFLPGHVPATPSPDDVETGHRSETSGNLSKSDSQFRKLLPNQDKVFSWQGICYDVPVKGGSKRLLDDVSGWVKPGTLTALMGMSGAGKTTLLNVLSQRMTLGIVTGETLVNGNTLGTNIRRKTGYVEQNDLHCETATVREALRFSATLRQPRCVSMEEKYASVEEVIEMLGMEEFAEAIIGNPGEGLNIEQRKLLTIGVELAAKPEVLIFLDEPTSGLDSQSSLSICSCMRKLADHGQAVLATIHQPSAVMFEQFDHLLILAKGGKTVYFGETGKHSHTLLSYLGTNGARPCEPAENPAEYILDVFSEGSQESSHSINWVDVWKQSPQNQKILDHLHEISSNPSQASIIDTQSELEFAVPITAQLYQVMKRDFQQYYRQPDYVLARLGLGLVAGLFIGFSFWMSDNSNQGFQNTLFSLFLLCTIFSTMVNQIMPKFMGKRALYELREGPSRTYSWKVFIFSQIVVELPWQALAGLCTWASFYFSVYGGNQDPERQGLVLLFVIQFFLFASSFAHLIGAVIQNPIVGSMLALSMFVMSLLSNGVMQPPSALPDFWSQMHRVSPLTYYVGGISATALHGRPIHCSDREMVTLEAPMGQTCGEYLGNYLESAPGRLYNWNSTGQCQYCPLQSADQYLASRDIFWDQRWRNYGILWAYFTFNILGAIFLYYLFRVLPLARANKARKTKP